ncbi:methylation-associated defense system restriction endonuclease subunit S MAD5 [Flavobacterium caseinilyticum]|uniref:Restriction endonuclease subunit S n=1 Tax=Flavobacterium caseinilyticum TaxID=2541732 RepID=A0A4V2YTT9_9FLAO|nr:restriction endonuclease subunit S [Flavobacterium caseinilyticum]TDD74857.1 restriction endonuclease subunit S [Flavobacterium caseinilyticum]
MNTQIVSSRWLVENDKRLDSKSYLNEGRLSHIKMLKSPYRIEKLNTLAKDIFNGARFKRYYVENEDHGISFMGSSDMLKLHINDLKDISKKYTKNINKLLLEKDWILISCSGTIGNTVYTNQDFVGKTASQHVMRVIPNNIVKSGFLYAYLTSKYGYSFLTQGTYGAVIQHIEPQHIKNIPIAVFPENKQLFIHDLISESSNLRVEANNLLLNVISVFEDNLNKPKVLKGFKFDTISSKKIFEFHKRFDSQYHVLWKSIKEEYTDVQYTRLSDLASNIFVGGRGKRMYVKKGVPFLSSSDMMLFNPVRLCKKVSSNTHGINQMKVNKYDILISRSGTVGNTVLVGDSLKGVAVSEHALRLIIDKNKISPNYVYAYLKTKIGIKKMEASSFGSVIITLNEDLIGNIEIPIFSIDIQAYICEKIDLYLMKMDLATMKENQAIDLIEKEIDSWQ